MERRKFIRNTSLGLTGLAFVHQGLGQGMNAKSRKLTILHTNDTHSNIDPLPDNHPKYPGMGGVAKRHALIKKIRSEEQHVLLFDAGDIFQGTPYFNTFKGHLEMKLMTAMGYDAATMGNHDFDIGLEGFIDAQTHADFPFLCSNYDFSNTIMEGKTQAHTIFYKGGMKIGVFGIGVNLESLVPNANYGKMIYKDPIETANQQAAALTEKGCDIVICLSHLGYEYKDDRPSDRLMAKKTRNIHLILGGHSHTFLEKPVLESNLDGIPVLINQTGWAGINLGRIDIDFDQKLVKGNTLKVE